MTRTKLTIAAIAILACVLLAGQLEPVSAAAKRRAAVGFTGVYPPIGVPLDTLGERGAIEVGGQSYGGDADVNRLSYVVLGRTTGDEFRSGTVPGDSAGIKQLSEIANDYGGNDRVRLRYLMIISGRKGPTLESAGAFFSLLKKLGAELITPDQGHSLAIERVPFSIIGIPGAPAGAATLRIPSAALSAGPSGAITGYLQENLATLIDGQPVYDYVAGEYPEFDTRRPTFRDRTNAIIVGDAKYMARLADSKITGASAGFQVLILDSLDLHPLVNDVLVTNATDSGHSDRYWQGVAAARLKQWLDQPSGHGGPGQPDVTVFVQTIGKPKAAGPEWASVVGQLVRLGANAEDLYYLNGSNEYAIVDRLGSSQPPAESSTASDQGVRYAPARLVGVLGRTRMSTFEPLVEATPTSPNAGTAAYVNVIKVAYRPLRPWPRLAPDEPDRAKAAAAEHYICEKLGFCQARDSCPFVRACYSQKYNSNWTQKHSDLEAVRYQRDQGFGEGTFDAVKNELLDEISAVGTVKSYVNDLQAPFESVKTESWVNLQEISKDIVKSVNPPRAASSTSSTLELISKLLGIGKLASGPVGQGASALAGVLSLAAFFSKENGQPILGGEITAKADELGGQLFGRFNAARAELAGLGKVLVSDYGKVTEAKQHIDSDWSLPDFTTTAKELTLATKRWFYEVLVPVAYPYLIRGDASNARQLDCQRFKRDGWPNQPDDAQMQAPIGYDNNGHEIRGIFFFTRGIFGGSSPPGGLGEEMFASQTAQKPGLEIEKLSFFAPSVFGGNFSHAANHTPDCQLGWLPQLP